MLASLETNKLIARRFLEAVFNRRERSVVSEIVVPEISQQVEQSLSLCNLLLAACPDFHLTVEDSLAEDELVVCHLSWRGTHTAESMGIPPTGRRLAGKATEMFWMAESKVARCSQNWTTWGRLEQVQLRPQSGVATRPPEEPVLDIAEVQGDVLGGFQADYQTLLFLRMQNIRAGKEWLRALTPHITSLETLLAGRRGQTGASAGRGTWINIAFSYDGLRKLTTDADAFVDLPFKEGLHVRSRLLGDPVDTVAEGNCDNWVIGGPHNVPDILLLIANDDRSALDARVALIVEGLPDSISVTYKETGAQLHGAMGAHEHFGFRDPVSQPGVRGRLSAAPADFLTPRENPENPHQGKPGQNLVWPGEFIFGYPGQNAIDLFKPGLIADAGPAWGKNGSLLVFRRLKQDVVALRNFLQSTARKLSTQVPGLADLTPEKLCAKFMGRWPSGAPILCSPKADNAQLAQNPHASNNFRFVEPISPSNAGPEQQGNGNGVHPQNLGDVLGLVCPQAAHIRKAYPRDHATSIDTVASMETHRILRRGIPFGEPFPAPGERGLLFLAYQTSIERQFEFITRAWLNNPYLRSGGDGHDPIAGQRLYGRGGSRARNFVLPVQRSDGTIQRVTVELPTEWVTPTGGGYFFVPSLTALRNLAQ